MSRPRQLKNVGNAVIAAPGSTINTSLPAPSVFAPSFPVGDMLLKNVHIRLYGNENNVGAGSGTAIVNGPALLLRSMIFETDKHGRIIDNVDGLTLSLFNQARQKTVNYQTLGSLAAAGTPAFEANFELQLESMFCFRPYDSVVDLKNAKPALTVQAGLYADLNNAGFATTNDIQNLAYNVAVEVLNGPVVEPGATDQQGNPMLAETPDWMPYMTSKAVTSTTTAAGSLIDLTWGDRIIRRIMIQQRDTTSASARALLANTVITTTGSVGLLVNSFPWGDRIQWGQLLARNKGDFAFETISSGYGFLDFDDTGRYGDYLSVLSRDAGTVQLYVDITGVANSSLFISQECYKAIPDAALRPSQLQARSK